MDKKQYNYALGFDIGVASIGWSAVELDEDNNPKRILDLGARIFKALDNDKGKLYNETRREKRGLRRLVSRRKERLRRIYSLCRNYGLYDDKSSVFNYSTQDTIYDIKLRGLEEELTGYELVRCLVHYAKNRGFKSNRKGQDEDKDASKIKESIHRLDEIQKQHNCTITRAMQILKEEQNLDKYKNQDGEYVFFYSRLSLEEEANQLLDKQIECGLIDEAFKEKYMDILLSQRDFSEGPGFKDFAGNLSPYAVSFEQAFGICKFTGENRIAKCSPSFEIFVMLQKLLDFRYYNRSDRKEVHSLSVEEVNKVYQTLIAKPKEIVNFGDVCKTLKIDLEKYDIINLPSLTRKQYLKVLSVYLKPLGESFKYADLNDEQLLELESKVKQERYKATLFKLTFYNDMSKKLNCNDVEILDSIATILTFAKTDAKIDEYLAKPEYSNIPKELHETLKEAKFKSSFAKSGSLSLSLTRKLIQEFLKGYNYSQAMENLGMNHADVTRNIESFEFPTVAEIEEIYSTVITSPNVRHVLVMLRKLYNMILKTYGKPKYVRLELAREMNKSYTERLSIEREQLDNRVNRLNIKNKLASIHNVSDRNYFSNEDILRYQLYEEQDGICMYSGEVINIKRLLTNDYQADHIIPYSISFDDSFNNKVLVTSKANQEKRNQIPMKCLKGDDLFNFQRRVKASRLSQRKKDQLLIKEYTKDADFSNRDFNDTAYVSKLVSRVFKDLFNVKNEDSDKSVTTNSGGQTSLLRYFFQLNKYTHSLIAEDYNAYNANNLKYYITSFATTKDSLTVFFENKLGMKMDYTRKVLTTKRDGKEDFRNVFEETFSYLLNNKVEVLNDLITSYLERKDILNIKDNELLAYSNDDDFNARRILSEIFVAVKQQLTKKDRDTHFHHMVDATLIAIMSNKLKANLNKYQLVKQLLREQVNRRLENDETVIDPITGEIIPSNVFLENEYKKYEVDKNGNPKFNPPYPTFVDELVLRIFERDENTLKEKVSVLPNYQKEDIENVHVRYPSHYYSTKVSGALHAETLVGVKENVGALSRVSIDKLDTKKLEKLYDKEGGQKQVYEALVEWFNNKQKGKPQLPNGRPIKKVTLVDENVDKLLKVSDKNNSYAGISELARILVFKEKGTDSLYFAQIDNMRYLKYSKKDYDFDIVLWKGQGENNKFIFNCSKLLQNDFELYNELIPGESVEIHFRNGKDAIYCGIIGFSVGKLEISSIIGDNVDIGLNFVSALRNYITISTIKSIQKVKIDILGNLVK